MPQQMTQQVLTFVLDGTTYLLVNNNENNNNNSSRNDPLMSFATLNPLTYAMEEEEETAAQPSSNAKNLNAHVEGEETVDLLPLLDFSALTSSLQEKDEEEMPIPRTVLEMDQDQDEEHEEESMFEDERAKAVSLCPPFAAESSASPGSDLASLLGSVSGALDPSLLTPSSSSSLSPDLLLHTPTSPTTTTTFTPWQLVPTIPTTTSAGDCDMSLASGTSFPFVSASSGDCHGSVNSMVTLPHTPPASASSCQIMSSSFSSSTSSSFPFPVMNRTASSYSSSSCGDDVSSSFSASSSSSDFSTPGFEEVMSFNDVFLSGIGNPNSPRDIVPLESSNPAPQLADTRLPSEENCTTWNDSTIAAAAAPEVRVVTSGNGAQCLLLLPAANTSDKMAAAAVAEKEEEEEKRAEEAVKVLETCSLTPLVKEELKFTIQSRRLAAGKAELQLAPMDVSRTRACRRSARGAGEKTTTTQQQLTDEERERDGKRREQNRQAAQRFRQKQRDTETVLSKKCRKLEGSNSSLRQEILRLAREVQQLQHAVDTHLPSCSRSPKVAQ